jgi:release factor glutamine methyltransferase
MGRTSAVTLRDLVANAATRLRDAGLPPTDAAFDAELLARTVLSWDRATLLTRIHDAPPEGFLERYESLVTRREHREPAAQVIGFREFWGRPFRVTRDVLVPRPETELIVEEALRRFPGALTASGERVRLADIGTGSGCLAISLALAWPAVDVTATDISEAALAVAKANALRHGVSTRIQFVRTDLFDGLTAGFHLVVANPPYVQNGDRPALSPEVRDYEPAEALFGGEDGLEVIRRLLDGMADALHPQGVALMEFGAGQDDIVADSVSGRPRLRLERLVNDLKGIPRMAVIARRT